MSSVHRPELDQHPDSRHPAAADRPGPVIEPSTAILRAGAVAATRWQGFERTSRRALGDLAGALHMSAGALWLATGGTLAPRTVWSSCEQVQIELEDDLRSLRPVRGERLAGEAWKRRACVHRASSP